MFFEKSATFLRT